VTGEPPAAEKASLIVVDPHGSRTRFAIDPLPFRIGRQPDNHIVLRDARVSRVHARIVAEGAGYVLEDNGSRHGTWVNGQRVTRRVLENSDKIEFGGQESYQLVFALDSSELKRLMEQVSASDAAPPGVGANLAKLRAILDLARALQHSLSIDEVLSSLVDTALTITGAERGFLLLRGPAGLGTRIARHRRGHHLHETELRVPREVIQRALHHRRELLSMNFEPAAAGGAMPQGSIADLELRSVVCVPLVRIRAGQGDTTSVVISDNETVGVLYMDSRAAAADLAGGNREILQTLAIEASTVLENARLLEEERGKRVMEEELKLARAIQQSLLPRSLPAEGWLRACGSSVASHQVGGDYFDVSEAGPDCWSAVAADVSGKGVGSALLASLLQGALITAVAGSQDLGSRIARLNGFLLERTGGEKYATVFYALLDRAGCLSYVNAAHCPPLVAGPGHPLITLETTGMPVGLVDSAEFAVAEHRLCAGDKLVVYTDGVTEAQNAAGEFFGRARLEQVVSAGAASSCAAVHNAIQDAVAGFTEGAPQSDDITVLVLEFHKGT
jgi:phosphoserine phosphatase RsbU/P